MSKPNHNDNPNNNENNDSSNVFELQEEEAENQPPALTREDVKQLPPRSPINMFWLSLASVSVVVQVVAMAIKQVIVVYIMGAVGLLIAPVVVKRQNDIRKKGGVREAINEIRMDVNRLQVQNVRLTENVDELESNVNGLKESEVKFEEIAKTQDANVSNLVDLVKENKAIVKEMKANLEAELQQKLLEAVLISDRDGDLKISQNELELLVLRLKNLDWCDFDAGHLRRKILESTGKLSKVLSIVRGISFREDVEDDDCIFQIKPEKMTEA